MEIQIKKAVKAANSSAIILPRAWLNKEVRVELIKKTPEIMLLDVINILTKQIDLKNVIGIYLTGSYARGEESEDSDIDILVITDNIDREIIKEGIYSILVISSELLQQKLKQNLFPIGQMIKEARALLNLSYLDSIKIKVTKENVKWYLDTTEDKLELVKKLVDKYKNNKESLSDRVAYTLILRIRTLYIIKKLIDNKKYSKIEFINLVKNISKGTNAYERYLAVKNDLKEKSSLTLEEAVRLYEYLEQELAEIKRLVKRLK